MKRRRTEGKRRRVPSTPVAILTGMRALSPLLPATGDTRNGQEVLAFRCCKKHYKDDRTDLEEL
ncbi:MAG TPA: hypothetical protein PLM33_01025 [Acidobacteriota bacterium]|nr:hypothetical protein [Acidobacteriota bacterium]